MAVYNRRVTAPEFQLPRSLLGQAGGLAALSCVTILFGGQRCQFLVRDSLGNSMSEIMAKHPSRSRPDRKLSKPACFETKSAVKRQT